jgi:hypothetical protein
MCLQLILASILDNFSNFYEQNKYLIQTHALNESKRQINGHARPQFYLLFTTIHTLGNKSKHTLNFQVECLIKDTSHEAIQSKGEVAPHVNLGSRRR